MFAWYDRDAHNQQTRDIEPMLARRLRRRVTIEITLVQCLVFAGTG